VKCEIVLAVRRPKIAFPIHPIQAKMKILAKIFGWKKPDVSTGEIWPFSSPPNEATFTVGKILKREKPILLVQHDDEDGSWQFLTGEPFDISDAKIVGLGEIAKLDPSILELADMPPGWHANRETATSSWRRENNVGEKLST